MAKAPNRLRLGEGEGDKQKGTHWTVIAAILGGSGIVGIVINPLISSWYQPDIGIEISPIIDGNTIMTNVKVTNNGQAPATNVRLTLNGYTEFDDYRIGYSSEYVKIVALDNRTNLAVAELPRLANGAETQVLTWHNSTALDLKYDVFVTYDQGSKKSTYRPPDTFNLWDAMASLGSFVINGFISVIPFLVIIGIAIVIYRVYIFFRDEY